MIDNLGEMHWVARRVHPILPCMKLYWDGFGLSYTKKYRVRGGIYRAQGGVYVEHGVVFRWFGLSYTTPNS